ncbi:MAG: HAD family hydrolase [Oscillospiraceae bacterium]
MNIIFDIGMVLADFRWQSYCRELGFSEEVIAMFGERMINDPIWDEFDLSIIPHKILIDKIGGRFPDNKKEYALFWQDITKLVVPFEYTSDWLRELKAAGHNIYLLSNYPKFMFEIHSQSWDFLKYTDGRVVSYEYHVMKPDPIIYNILLKKYDLAPEDCIFLDDREVNIKGAEDCGIRGILFTDFATAAGQLSEVLVNSEE